MRQYSLLLTICWMLLAVAASAVEYQVGQSINLRVTTSARTVAPGFLVQISISAGDVDYLMGANNYIQEKIDDPVTISYEANGGSLQRRSVTSNPLELTWSSPIKPGNYAIFITARDSGKYAPDPAVRQIVEITVQQQNTVPAPAVRLTSDAQTLRPPRHRTASLTAQVLGNNAGGKTVRFFATRGTLSATQATTNAGGLATVTLTVTEDDAGTATVAASYGTTTATTNITIIDRDRDGGPVIPPPPYTSNGLLIDVNPPTLPADGQSTANVTVRLTDRNGYPISRQAVIFRTTMGRIQAYGITNYYGYATVRLIASDTPGTGYVTADAAGLRSYTPVVFYDVRPQPGGGATGAGTVRIFLTIDPNTLPGDGTSRARIEALVLDTDGRAVVNTPVLFTATLGRLQPTSVNTGADGKAVTTLYAADRPGTGTVTAQVGQVQAAGQIVFQALGQTAGQGLDVRSWRGQQSSFVNEGLVLRQVHVEGNEPGATSSTLIVLDTTGRAVREINIGDRAVLVYDQYGAVRGYGTESDQTAKIQLLRADGAPLRAVTVNLPLGSHLVEARYAEPGGQLVVTQANPDGSRPEVALYGPNGAALLSLRNGLESLPVLALSGDGYLALALPGGSVRLYAPSGTLAGEARRTDGLQARQVAVGPNGSWVAVSAGTDGKPDVLPRVTVFSRQGTPIASFEVDAMQLTPAGANALVASGPERTSYLNLATRRIDWTLAGGYERFLAVGAHGIIAGMRDPKTQTLISRVSVVRLSDGKVIASQDFNDLRSVNAILPPDANGFVCVVTMTYAVRFPLPADAGK
ncbi:MAG: Ig-like domain-containing protein [Armatimonadota bacterium]